MGQNLSVSSGRIDFVEGAGNRGNVASQVPRSPKRRRWMGAAQDPMDVDEDLSGILTQPCEKAHLLTGSDKQEISTKV